MVYVVEIDFIVRYTFLIIGTCLFYKVNLVKMVLFNLVISPLIQCARSAEVTFFDNCCFYSMSVIFKGLSTWQCAH